MNRKITGIFALALCAGVAACDGSSTDLVDLSEAQVSALADVLFSTTAASAQDQGAAAAPSRTTTTTTIEQNVTVPCPLGGTVAVGATVAISSDPEANTSSVEFSQTQTHTGCMAQSEDGHDVTIDGAPNLTVAFTIASDAQGLVTVDGSMNGGLDVVVDDASGSCQVALEFSGEGSQEAQSWSATLSGTVCGVSVSRSVSAAIG